MHVIVNIEVIEKYFRNFIPRTKSEFERNLDDLFSNKNNTILLSKNFIDLAEQHLEKIDPKYRAYFAGFLQDLYTHGRHKGVKSGDSSSLEDEFISILNLEDEGVTIAFSISKSPKLSSHKKKNKIAALTSYSKLSDEWVLLNIAATHNLKVRYYDFTSNSQIDKFFETIFAIPKKIDEVHIFDRYCNVNHNLYKSIAKKKINIKCFKLKASLADIEPINSYFGKPCEIWNTNRGDLLHERNVLFNNFIIESNEDPVNVAVDRKTWTFNIQYSKEDYSRLISKKTEFNLYS
jgi:hypothetical protein